jgi:hypothetical protein
MGCFANDDNDDIRKGGCIANDDDERMRQDC